MAEKKGARTSVPNFVAFSDNQPLNSLWVRPKI